MYRPPTESLAAFSAPAEACRFSAPSLSAPSHSPSLPRSLSAGEPQPGRSGAAHALAVDEGGALLFVLGARHPQLVLRAHAAQDGAAQPRAVLALAWRVAAEEHDAVRLAGDGGWQAHVARRHLEMAISWKGEILGVLETRRHYTNYFKGIPNFKPYRTAMVTSDGANDVFAAFDRVLNEVQDLEWV